MFDRQLFHSVDVLLAELESVVHARSNVMVDRLAPGTWGQTFAPSESNPVALIIVSEQAREFQHAIASWNARMLLRKYEHDVGLVATLNPTHLQSVEKETRDFFAAQVPADKLPGLARILYDGIANQIRSVINGLVIHHQLRSAQKDLALQYKNWVSALIRQNQNFWKQAVSSTGQYPERMIRWNRAFLALEAVGLGRITDLTTPAEIADSAEAKTVGPLLDAIIAGDADALSDRELTGLACRFANVPEDWLDWVHAQKAWIGPTAPTGTRDTISEAIKGQQTEHQHNDDYSQQLTDADRLRTNGENRAAAKIYGRLMSEGGNADQRVLVGRALAIVDDKPSEAIRLAKLAIGLDPSTALADEAGQIISKRTGEQIHKDLSVRPDVIAYLSEALDFFARNEETGKKAWAEIGMLASGGVSNDGQARYRITSIDGGKMLTGLAMMAWIYAGTQKWAPQLVASLPDFNKEWKLAVGKGK